MILRSNASQKIHRQGGIGDALERGVNGHPADLGGIDEANAPVSR